MPDISLALPTRYLQLATIVDEYQLPKELKNETDLDPIAYFNDLEESDGDTGRIFAALRSVRKRQEA